MFRLSLSTTFGGSPVVAHSPFCLLVANVNTLMAQFLFVFLSGGGKLIILLNFGVKVCMRNCLGGFYFLCVF